VDKRHLYRLLWLLPLAVVVVYLLDRYLWISAEEEVRRFIDRGRREAESLSVLRCDPLLASDFKTGSGMERGAFLYFARLHFRQLSELHVDVRDIEITLSEDESKAEVNLRVMVAGVNRDGTRWLGFREGRNRAERVFVRVEKRDGDWKAVFLDWEDSRRFSLD
jgi:hypothetical protein